MSVNFAKNFHCRRVARIASALLLGSAIAAATAIACSWPGTSHSVRFNGYQTEREMGRLPPLPTLANGLNEARAHWDIEEDVADDGSERPTRTEVVKDLWERAEAAEKDGNLRLDRELLRDYLKQSEISRDLEFGPSGNRNSAIDRLDALGALDRGSKAATVNAYLTARRAHDSEKPADEVEPLLDLARADRNLQDNVAYLRAAELYRQKQFDQAAKEFRSLTRRYPQSEKYEGALFMTAVSIMKTSSTYIPQSGNADYGDAGSHETDQAWQDSFSAFQKLIEEHPQGRYSNDAKGWLAYLLLRKHDRAGALIQYYGLLADNNENARIEAAFSLTLVRSSATDVEMLRVESQLAKEPQAALAYAYHNIYNYSIDPSDLYPPYEEPQPDSSGEIDYEAAHRAEDAKDRAWTTSRNLIGRTELTRTLEFSRALMTRYPKLSLGGSFALRAAEASKELGQNDAAVSFVHRALKSELNDAQKAEALWTLGIAEHRLRHFEPARQALTRLVRDYQNPSLVEGARRTLAMIAEDAGNINDALDQYLALDYSSDVGYFVDVLMTPEQLAAFIETHPETQWKNELTYALGIRYLRANRWNDARKTLAQVQTTAPSNASVYSAGNNCDGYTNINCVDPKEPEYGDADRRLITNRLVMRDIQTANDLETLERVTDQAVGDEAKAEALYQLASYQYQSSQLLFHNPISGNGYWKLSELAAEDRYRTTNESQILFAHLQEHDTPARALKINLEIVARFPHTRAARDALYTAAVCHERLSNYNPYWREIYQNGLHAGTRMVTYQDVKAAYPDYQLPRGTYGWQPATRTVNGGPGWQAPAKAPPRLTKTARVILLTRRFTARLERFWQEDARRWLTEVVIVVLLFYTARVAARNRRRLYSRVARNRSRQSRVAISYPWIEMFWIDRLEPSRREQLEKFVREKRMEFLELARDHGSRPVLVRSVVSHTLLLGLAIKLIAVAW
jgi:TolA-binding protein